MRNSNYLEIKGIGKIIDTDLEKLCGNKMWMFTFSAVIDEVEKIFELKYDV
ncbi:MULTISPECIES: hypothetical protein [unclassified Clostridium]|uniref:hypothetical protein n=1 Tax=unclassified Clostridium TaxID=2614128 RepID=UPI0002E665F7|nr:MULTISPECIES: hypothetical protein [unclassified Clostridium]